MSGVVALQKKKYVVGDGVGIFGVVVRMSAWLVMSGTVANQKNA
jgi:hypothetical protein